MANTHAPGEDSEPKVKSETAAGLLKAELGNAEIYRSQHPSQFQAYSPAIPGNTDLDALWKKCEIIKNFGLEQADGSCQNDVLMQYLLHQLQRSSGADLVLLKRRDFYFDLLGDEYRKYEVCEHWARDHAAALGSNRDFYSQYCRLRTALDRVLWKSDNPERVMVDGATLTGLMQTSQQQTDQEQTLLARDLHQEWLMTYGIITKPPTKLAIAASGPEGFSLPGSAGCGNTVDATTDSASPPYCINGQLIAPDRAYWVIASDQLAEDKNIYAALGAIAGKNSHADEALNHSFLTTEIADEIFRHGQPHELLAATKPGRNKGKAEESASAEANLADIETLHQDRKLIQLDIAKLVAGYSMVSPNISDTGLASDYSGVSNTQALTPHSQELDLEAQIRLTSSPWLGRFVSGAQSDGEYDRRVTGNISGNPETVTYSTNSYTVSGFTEVAINSRIIPGLNRSGINKSTRNLPRAFIVISPYQFQRQITGAFLGFPYFTPPSTTNSQEQLTIHVPTAMGFSQKAGIRYESA